MASANLPIYSNIALFLVVTYLCKVIYNVDSFHVNSFRSKHVDKIGFFNNNNNNDGNNHILQMSKLTNSAQERLLKDAENLRKMADTLERTNETDSTQDSGFISTYAIKIANNITKQKQNETLYFGPTKPFTSANVTKEYLLIDRSNSDDETPTVKLENLIKTTMLEYLNISETESSFEEVKTNDPITTIAAIASFTSISNSSTQSDISTLKDDDSVSDLVATTYTLRRFLDFYDEILQLQPIAKTYAALEVLDDYIQWYVNTLYKPLLEHDTENRLKSDVAFLYLARKLEIERFLRRLNKDPKYLSKLKESSYKPSEQDNTIATSFMEHNVYFDVAYDTLSDGTIVINSKDAHLCANKLQNEILQALAAPVRKNIDKSIAHCTDLSENGRKGLFEYLEMQDDIFSKLGTNGFLNMIPPSPMADVAQSMNKEEIEVYKQVIWGEVFEKSVNTIEDLASGKSNTFDTAYIDKVEEPLDVFNAIIRAKLIQSLRLYTLGWNWVWNENVSSFISSSEQLVPALPLVSTNTDTNKRQSPSQILKKFPQLSEMMFELPSDSLLLTSFSFTAAEIAFNQKNITFYVESSSSPSTSFSPFGFLNKKKNSQDVDKVIGNKLQTRMIFPVTLLKDDSKAVFYDNLIEGCNKIQRIINTFMTLNSKSTYDEIITEANQISPNTVLKDMISRNEKLEQLVNEKLKYFNSQGNGTTSTLTATRTTSTESIPTIPSNNISTKSQITDLPITETEAIINTDEIKDITADKNDSENESLFATREGNIDIVSNDKNLSNNFLKQFQDFIDKLDSEGGNELSLLSQPKSVVDAFIRQYFDENSRTKGSAISRQGAGLFQNEMLKGIMEVNNVTPLYGAYIFDGRYVTRNSKQFYEKLNSKFENSSTMSNDLSYIITTNRQYPAMNDTITDIAYAMMGETTSVILFPKSWNTTLQSSDEQLKFQSFFKSLNILSSAIVAGNCYNLFDPNNGPLAKDNTQLPDGYIGLVILPIMLQVIPLIIESIVAAQKGIKITSIQLPAWVSLPTFGYRSVYTSRPKTRNDMFDIAAVGWFSSFVLSFATALIGLKLTSEASSDVLETFPTISVLLLQLNPIVKQVLGSVFPLAAATPATAMDTVIHLHWIAIAGLMSMIVNALQLVPTNQSVGNKLLYSFYGIYQYSIVQQAVALFRFAFNAVWIIASFSFTESIFTINSRSALLFTFLLSEIQSFLPTELGDQVVVDDVTGITESRKIAFAGITCLLAFVLFSDGLSEMAVDLGNLAKQLFDGGLPKNQLF